MATSQASPVRQRRLPGAGVMLAASEWGDDTSPMVVLLHGGGQTRHAWDETGAALARDGFHVLAIDARGHGESDWAPDGDYSHDAMVNDLVSATGDVGEPVALVGASMGGFTALFSAGEKRLSTWAVVLVDIAPRIEWAGAARVLEFMSSRPDGFASLEDAVEAVGRYLPNRARPADPTGISRNLRRSSQGRLVWHWDPQFLAHVREHAPDRTRAAAAALDLEAPTLIVRGQLSDVLSEEGVREFLTLVPHAAVEDVSGAAHMVAGDRNDVFCRAVARFLQEHAPRQ